MSSTVNSQNQENYATTPPDYGCLIFMAVVPLIFICPFGPSFLTVGVPLLMLVLGQLKKSESKYYELTEHGQTIDGEIVERFSEVHTGSENDITYYYVKYIFAGGVRTRQQVELTLYEVLAVGTRVPILYLPNQPTVSRIQIEKSAVEQLRPPAQQARKPQEARLLWVFAVILAILTLVLLLMQVLNIFSFSLFALLSAVLLIGSKYQHKHEQANMRYTNGTITRKWEVTWGSKPTYKIAYTFDKGVETQQVVPEGFFKQADVGDTIRVRYLAYDLSVSTAVCSL